MGNFNRPSFILAILIAVLFSFSFASKVQAAASYRDYREIKLRNFFSRYRSPLAEFAADFVAAADKYGLDYKLVPAITGVESSFGLEIPINSYNAYGWNAGNWYFDNWKSSIYDVSSALRENYLNKGAREVWEIAPIYNPVTPAAWGARVLRFEQMIEDTKPVVQETLSLRLTI